MNNLQKLGGVAALTLAIIYIAAFMFFGMFLDLPSNANTTQKFNFLAENQIILAVVNLVIYVVFGIFLAVLVLALHHRLKHSAQVLTQLSSIFGLIWVSLVIASGMIANIGLATVIDLSITDTDKAMTVWLGVNIVVNGLGGGNEIVAGLWMLLLSTAALKSNELSRTLNYLGLFVGFMGILTIYPKDLFTEIFGLSQIIWFIWLGLYLLIKPLDTTLIRSKNQSD